MGKRKSRNSQAGPQATTAPLPAPPRRNWRPIGFLLACLVGAAVVSFIVFRYIAPRIPRDLVGTWKVVQGDLKGATLEFHWDGTAYASQYKGGKKETLESSVRVEDKQILMTYKNPANGKEETFVQTIVKLTDDELVIRDQDRNTYRLVRVRD
jgi:uncharacterized protein (TIGR03066 family)